VLEHQRCPEDHEQAVHEARPVRRGGEGVPDEDDEDEVIPDAHQPRLRRQAGEDLRGGEEQGQDHEAAADAGKRGPRAADQRVRDQQPRTHHRADQHHREHEADERRGHETHRAAVAGKEAESAEQRDGQEKERQDERFPRRHAALAHRRRPRLLRLTCASPGSAWG
jgi:hypothetical protein